MEMRELALQYQREAAALTGIIDKLTDGVKNGKISNELYRKVDMLYAMRRENLATYKHLLDYCDTVERRGAM